MHFAKISCGVWNLGINLKVNTEEICTPNPADYWCMIKQDRVFVTWFPFYILNYHENLIQ